MEREMMVRPMGGVVLVLLLGAVGCDREEGSVQEQTPSLVEEDYRAEPPASIEIGGIDGFPDDEELVERGERVFHVEGCYGCHLQELDKRGPRIGGISERRDARWVAAYIVDPEAMREADDFARRLHEHYPTTMPVNNVELERVEAIMAFLGAQ